MKNKSLLVIPSLLLLASCSNQSDKNTAGFARASDANFTNDSSSLSVNNKNTSLNQNIQRSSYITSNGSDSRSKAS
ncbi:MAG: hypothetical protein PHG82_03860 [Candidatus Gracilibacteria bacterium]|nr:hypothetical protein [Candidatus Gracilibacteria bacterium]